LLKVRGYNFTEDEFFNAIRQNDSAAVKLFLQGGIDANLKNQSGETALTHAVLNSNVNVLKVLAEKADLNLPDRNGNMPLYIALKKEKYENFNFLLDANTDPNSVGTVRSLNNQSVLYVAVLLKDIKIIKKLLEKGANPDLPDSEGSTPISEQVVKATPNMEIFNLLIEKSKNVDVADNSGSTILLYAAKNDLMPKESQIQIIKTLLAKGADKNLKDKKGKTALNWAKTKNNKEAIELLK
jgi:ankyrin repeat protein